MIPTKAQWVKWNLPSKYAAVGILIGIASLAVSFTPILTNQKNLSATEYTKKTQWYLDAKLTAKNMPKEFKEIFSKDDSFKKQLQVLVKDSLGVHSDEFKFVSSIPDDGNSLIEAFLLVSETKLVVTDISMNFITGINIKEAHNKIINNNNSDCSASTVEFKSVIGDIVKVSKGGITFKIPSQSFTEYSGCDANKVEVDFMPATAILKGELLVITHKEGFRFMDEINGKKVVRRKDVNYYFTLNPQSNQIRLD
jgi:hypothetical protein